VAVCEAFRNPYLDKEIPNNTTVYRLATEFVDTEVFVTSASHRMTKTAVIMAVPISSSASAAVTGYVCNNSILSLG
jgi:hypothetical protein